MSIVFSWVQFSRSVVQLSVTPWTAAHQASLSITNSQSPPKRMSIESMMPSSHLIFCRLPGANTQDRTHDKAMREKTWQARRIRFSGVLKRPAHEIPPMTRSRGESLTGKADQVFTDSEKLPPALTLKMISVFLMLASIDDSLISVTQAEGLPRSLSK